MSTTQKTLIAVVGAIVLVIVGIIGFAIGRTGDATFNKIAGSEDRKPVTGSIYEVESFKEQYPLQVDSFNLGFDYGTEGEPKQYGKFGGNDMFDHVLRQTELGTLFNNHPFAVHYVDDRSHVFAVEDAFDTKRVTDPRFTQRGACITCKTPYLFEMYEKYPGNNGWDHAKIDFETEMKANVEGTPGVMHNGVSCTMCHDPVDMELRVKSKHLFEAFERREANIGEPNPLKDPSKTSKQDMRTLVCAQCHVEYHFEPVTFRVVLPWDEGLTFDAMYEYYEKERKREGGFVRDFEHGISKALILKAQHPEYEAWTTGIHGKNNVACADCHMPYLTKNGQKYSDHNITSPLRTSKHVEASCMTCHDQTEKELVGYVTDVQDIFWSQQNQAEKAVAEAHRMIEKAMAAGISDTAIGEARELVREAQWAWDYVAAENSMGFHFAEQGMKTTGHAIVKANEAIITLYKAAGGRL